MASTRLRGGDVAHTAAELPAVGTTAPAFTLTGPDLADVVRPPGRVVLNIFPSLDTGVCATSVRTFNELAAALPGTTVICVSMDLPYAMGRFCVAEGIENVVVGSGFRSTFGTDYGVTMVDGRMRGLYARAVVVLDGDGTVLHTELVAEVPLEPDYEAAVAALG